MNNIQAIQAIDLSNNLQQAASLTDNPSVMERLTKTFPENNLEDIKKFIKKGEALEKILAEPNESKRLNIIYNQNIITTENATALMWLLTAKTAYYNQQYRSGAMRLENGESVYQFLKLFNSIQNKGSPVLYNRISSHLKENLGKKGKLQADKAQWGMDLMGLPGNSSTVLFTIQPDGSLFIKMEPYGHPPTWKKGYRTWNNLKQTIGHSFSFIETRFQKSTGVGKRKEHVPSELKKEFEHTMQLLFPPKKKSFFAKLFTRKEKISKEGKVLLEEGTKYGAYLMNQIVKTRIQELAKLNNSQAVLPNTIKINAKELTIIGDRFFETHTRAENEILTIFRDPKTIPENYNGQEFKGEEVLLPALGKTL